MEKSHTALAGESLRRAICLLTDLDGIPVPVLAHDVFHVSESSVYSWRNGDREPRSPDLLVGMRSLSAMGNTRLSQLGLVGYELHRREHQVLVNHTLLDEDADLDAAMVDMRRAIAAGDFDAADAAYAEVRRITDGRIPAELDAARAAAENRRSQS